MRWLILLALVAAVCLPVGLAAAVWWLGPWAWWQALGAVYGASIVLGVLVIWHALRTALPARQGESV